MLKAMTMLSATLIGAAVLAGPAAALSMDPGASALSDVETVQYYGGGYGRGGYGRGYDRPRRGVRPGRVVRDLLGVGPRRGYNRGGYGRPGYGYGGGYRGGY